MIRYLLFFIGFNLSLGFNANCQVFKPLNVFNNDTSAYLKYNLGDKGKKYANKSIGELLNMLNLPVISYLADRNFNQKRNVSDKVFLRFSTHSAQRNHLLSNQPIIDEVEIIFSPPFNVRILDSIGRKNYQRMKDGSTWTPEIDAIYRECKIVDIIVR